MKRQRLTSIDSLRGLVMVIMALDHVRDMLNPQALGFDFADADPPLFLTRWITHLCAPTFILLAGMGAFLYGSRGRSKPDVSRFLFTRGLWLIAVELTLVSFAWNFSTGPVFVAYAGVIWAIGVSMVALSVLVWMPIAVVAGIALTMIFGHNLLDTIQPSTEAPSALWLILHMQGFLSVNDSFGIYIIYPLVPWIGVMAIGYAIGPFFVAANPVRATRLIQVGLLIIVTFVLMRLLNSYGEPNSWYQHESITSTIVDFLHTTKYPPSLHFLLMTLGPAILLLGVFEKYNGRWEVPLLTIGRVPFLFYITHLYLIHAIAIVVGLAQGFSINQFTVVFFKFPEGFGVNLGGVYLFWIAVVLMLYPLCRWFSKVKRQRQDWWLSYL